MDTLDRVCGYQIEIAIMAFTFQLSGILLKCMYSPLIKKSATDRILIIVVLLNFCTFLQENIKSEKFE